MSTLAQYLRNGKKIIPSEGKIALWKTRKFQEEMINI
jgi:hypothetical protein